MASASASSPIDDSAGAGAGVAQARGPAPLVVAVVKDLFFVARIRETARLAGVPLVFARTPDEIKARMSESPRFVLIDLTGGFDYEAMFGAIEHGGRATGGPPNPLGVPRPPVLAFTTHALAKQTQPWHARCDRVVTKETLTAELGTLLKEGIAS
jgi:hypothetical protein